MSDATPADGAAPDTPRPRRWALARALRRSVRDIANIVLGVLIALAVGEVANDIRTRADVAAAHRAIRIELSKIVGQGLERNRLGGCVERRLDTVARTLDEATRSGRLPPLGPIASVPIRAWPRGVWDGAIREDTRAHFGERELASLAGAFGFAPTLTAYNVREFELWSNLAAMVGPGRRIAPEEIAMLRAAVIEARARNRAMIRMTKTVRWLSEMQGTAYDRAFAAAGARRLGDSPPICRPIPTRIPPFYGSGEAVD